jgi:hypothetical protein
MGLADVFDFAIALAESLHSGTMMNGIRKALQHAY